MPVFSHGEWVLLASPRGKRWLLRIEDSLFSCHLGSIQLSDVVGREEGDSIDTNTGSKLLLLRPTLEDYIFKMNRQTQIIYPKDLGAIIFYGDIQPGDMILESGIGSGALTLALLRAIGGRGKVISVERKWDFAMVARKNIRRFHGSSPETHQIIIGDINELKLNVKVDRAFLDLPEPWLAIGNVSQMLRRGGLLLTLSPNVGQVQMTYRELRWNGFTNMTTFELLKRDWMVDELRARPVDRMVSHTGFITVAKKTGISIQSSSESTL